MRINRNISIEYALVTDYRIARRLIKKPDFYEGVRALLVDKDNKPKWQPSAIDLVMEDDLMACFESLGNSELVLTALGL